MNAQDALDIFFGIPRSHGSYSGDAQYYQAMATAFTALQEKAEREKSAESADKRVVPDPETGLVPCGCGGEPELVNVNDHHTHENDYVYIFCKGCGIHVSGADEGTTMESWNTALGYREGAE